MFSNEDQVKAIGLMSQNELCLAELYNVYAGKFPEAGEFWRKMAKEEEGHARILKNFQEGLKIGELVSRDRVFSSNVYESITYIKGKIAEAREKPLTLKDALVIGDLLESSFLEEAYFRVVAGDSSRFRSGIISLVQDTERHKALLKDMLQCLI